MREDWSFHLLACYIQFSRHLCWRGCPLSKAHFLVSLLSWELVGRMCVWVCFWVLYTVPLVYVTLYAKYYAAYATMYVLKSCISSSPALLFMLKMTLVIWVFCAAIHILGLYFVVLWRKSLVFWWKLHSVCRYLWTV